MIINDRKELVATRKGEITPVAVLNLNYEEEIVTSTPPNTHTPRSHLSRQILSTISLVLWVFTTEETGSPSVLFKQESVKGPMPVSPGEENIKECVPQIQTMLRNRAKTRNRKLGKG